MPIILKRAIITHPDGSSETYKVGDIDPVVGLPIQQISGGAYNQGQVSIKLMHGPEVSYTQLKREVFPGMSRVDLVYEEQ